MSCRVLKQDLITYTNPIAILYANLLPVRQDGEIILPASQHMNHHLTILPADRSAPADRL